MQAGQGNGRRVDVDAHVHLYDGFDRDVLFRRLGAEAARRGRPLVLALTESAAYDAFRALRAERGGAYTVRETDDPLGLTISVEGADLVHVVAGRQLVSREGLEVLALGLDASEPPARVPDRERPAEALIASALEAGAVCVLPWSVGKWLGARGRLVETLVAREDFSAHRRFFLGDIPARARPWPRPGVFDRGVRVLCGTDPLPVAGAEAGIGRYRSVVSGRWDAARPWTSLRRMLETADTIDCEGRRDGLVPAVRDQVRVRIARRA